MQSSPKNYWATDPKTLGKMKRLLDREKAERNQTEFIKQAWPVIEPAVEYQHNWHIDLIAEYLQAVLDHDILRLIINVPPRSMKSLEATVTFPAWAWIRRPELRFIKVSYSSDLSRKHNVLTRDIIRSPWYQNNWGDRFAIKHDTNRQDEFKNDHQGLMYSTSVGGALTGEGGDIIIVDDPQNPVIANSEVERLQAVNFFTNTLQSRLNNPKTGAFIIIMQRLHEKDLTGHILAEDLGYTHVCLPAEAEKRTIITFPKTLKTITREEGDILNPQRYPKDVLEGLKKSMGSLQYAGQYQQAPSPADGAIFKREWFSNTYRPEAMPYIPMMIQSWDLPFKKSEGSAECAGIAMGRKDGRIYLIDVVHDKMGFTETVATIKNFSAKHPKARAKVIEDKANGPAVMDFLQKDMAGMIPYNPHGSKEERAISVTPYFEAGNILLPEGAPWVQDFIEQFVGFPRRELKDMVDATVQGILYLFDKPVASLPPEAGDLMGESYWRG